MTDYNDGKWHVWSGGECPVHPKSEVEAVWHDPRQSNAGVTGPRPAKVDNEPTLAWAHVVKFRVTKPYREPRTMWAVGAHLHDSPELAASFIADIERANPGKGYADSLKIVKMVEVLE